MIKKQTYDTPETEIYFVKIEENILSGGGIKDITDPEDDSENWG